MSGTAAQFVEGLTYPIAKSDVLLAAADMQLPDTVVQKFADITDREYQDADDLTGELNATSS